MTSGQLIIFHLSYLNRIVNERANALLNKDGLTLHAEQIPVLMALFYCGPLSQQELANRLFRNKSSIQRTVVNLSRHQMVTIVDDCWDRRKNIVALTTHARELVASLSQSMKELEQQLFQHISTEDRQKAIKKIKELDVSVN